MEKERLVVTTLLRSNVEAAKRVFLDRLTTDQQPLDKPQNLDGGPGDEYVYANVGDSGNFGIGFDCSGLCGVVLAVAVNGPGFFTGVGYYRLFSTETFPGVLQGFRQTTQADLVNGAYPIKVMIMHGGGGPDSHMACIVDGIQMESNGTYGLCTAPDEITPMSYWNDFWVWDGPITEDTPWRQPMSYPRGLDYAGGRISGADLKANGIAFVCRYLSDGGSGLPGKQLLPNEFADLVNNGIAVVFNWETTSNFMLGGYSAGVADAQTALAYVRSLPGAPSNPVVYFSCDFDEAPNQDTPIEQYLQGAANVLGGMQFVGIYGSYYICTRAQATVGVKYIWQTEAWSGSNITAAVNIMQRNGLGYQTIDGVECDINEAHTDDYGQFLPAPPAPPTPAPSTGGGAFMALTDQQQSDLFNAVMGIAALIFDTNGQLRGPNQQGWPQLGTTPSGENLTIVDALSVAEQNTDSIGAYVAAIKTGVDKLTGKA
jgi:hypothetical protein